MGAIIQDNSVETSLPHDVTKETQTFGLDNMKEVDLCVYSFHYFVICDLLCPRDFQRSPVAPDLEGLYSVFRCF